MDQRKKESTYKQIEIYGMVQGVGFRPAVSSIARKYNVAGTVRNIAGSVRITACAGPKDMARFLDEIQHIDLPNSKIESMDVHDLPAFQADGFTIRASGETISGGMLFFPKDTAICGACLSELKDPDNRRYRHPFISCTDCGPRFSILKRLPYDRANTSMHPLAMCAVCEKEYHDIADRRCHAQTISCHQCEPVLAYHSGGRAALAEQALTEAAQALQQGKVIAIKGVGGYHFACSPYNKESVDALRGLKNRDAKPFAVMFPDIEAVKAVCRVNETEESLLTSRERPIVLLRVHAPALCESVCGQDTYGCFLPYTALHHLLLEQTGPLVMTSANQSDTPMIRQDSEILSIRHPSLHGVLTFGREILRRLDDSVMQANGGAAQTIRIGRGLAPLGVKMEPFQSKHIFAAGSDLKNNFCIMNRGYAVMSQYIGDLENADTNAAYRESAADYFTLYGMIPDLAACDMHPAYHSAAFAKSLRIPVVAVQHHHAHIASVMAEHGIGKPVIGVCFDGTGYGTDGHIWGGEFLVCEDAGFDRAAHLEYATLLGGNGFAKDAKRAAYCYLKQAGMEGDHADANILSKALIHGINTVQTSSMGRLFDAVASILDIAHTNRYEGECAIKLEQLAGQGKHGKVGLKLEYTGGVVSWDSCIRDIYNKKKDGAKPCDLAYAFHLAVAQAVLEICTAVKAERGIVTVCVSGGVFQNRLLHGLVAALLETHGFEVFANRLIPPNDSGIALGQAYVAARMK